MGILLDTNALLWLLEGNPRLGRKAHQVLADTNHELYASYFSLYEMKVKASVGKMRFDINQLLERIEQTAIGLLMPELDDLRDYTIANPANKDPFDNMLITVAKVNDLTLATSDRRILATEDTGLRSLNVRL